jgi:hypothetical protein
MYSLRMSFWVVPLSSSGGTPCSSATSSYSSSNNEPGALMVIDVETSPSGMSCISSRMSSIESMATPVRPTSPSESGWSESSPSWVGRSKATESPVWPRSSSSRKRWLVSSADEKPAYWRIVQGRLR